MTMSFKLSPGGMYQNGEQSYIKHWYTPPPRTTKHQADDDDKEKKVILSFEANDSDLDDGKFGYDNYDDYDGKCTSDKNKLKQEYKPIRVYGNEYYPVWVSMRKGQTITLNVKEIKLGKIKTTNYKLFNEIKFADHPDFAFAPADLKNADKVQITCKNNNPATAQIKVEADGETVGAINFFYPEPKKIDLRWVVVNFNEGDKDLIKKNKFRTSEILKEYFKKAFNPSLVDINIVNEESETVDLTTKTTNKDETNFIAHIKEHIKEGTKDESKSDEKDRRALMNELYALHKARKEYRIDQNEITLLLTNLKCKLPVKEEEEGDSNNGIGLRGISLLFLGNNEKNPKQEIPHEIMHAIGLQHTFKEKHDTPGSKKHTYKEKGTPNFMDYETKQNRTFYWQWEEIYNSTYSK